jgi:hypothetical protein
MKRAGEICSTKLGVEPSRKIPQWTGRAGRLYADPHLVRYNIDDKPRLSTALLVMLLSGLLIIRAA